MSEHPDMTTLLVQRKQRAIGLGVGAGVLALLAVLGVPPFYPIGSGPVGGLGIIANMILYPLTLCTLGGAIGALAMRQEPAHTTGQRVWLGLLSLVNLAVGTFVVWGLAESPPGSLTRAHVLALWGFGLLDVAVGLLGAGMALTADRLQKR